MQLSRSQHNPHHQEGDDERLPEHGSDLFGNLLSLFSVSGLRLAIIGKFAPPPRLRASWLDAMPSTGTTLKQLSLDLDTFEAPTAETLARVIPQLRLAELFLSQDSVAAPDPTTTSEILRAVLQSESEIEIALLAMHSFDLSMIEPECWDLLAGNRILKELNLGFCDLGVNSFELLASALKRSTTLQKLMLDANVQ